MDDLTKIKGVGKATAARLGAAGIATFAALAALQPGDEPLPSLTGPAEAARWIAAAQAKLEYEGKPPRPDHEPEALSRGGAGLPADGGVGDPHNTPADNPESEKGGGGGPLEGVSAVPPGREAWLAMQELGEDEARLRYPLLLPALQRWAEEAGTVTRIEAGLTIRIAARREGFRRAGMAHPKAPADYPAERFTPAALEALLAEPMLIVELV